MLLGEPPRTQFDLNFSFFGIPIRVHPIFWLATLILGRLSDAASVLTWIAAVFASIMVHELGHALVMRAYGFRPWIILYGLGGLTSYDQSFAFRRKGSGPLGQILISLAGPAAGFLLAAALWLTLKLAGYDVEVYYGMFLAISGLENLLLLRLFHNIFYISVVWGVINLFPVYPLDGGQIVRELFLLLNPRDGIRQSLTLSIFTACGMAIVGFVQLHSIFAAMLFAFLAYESFAALMAYSGRNRW